MISDLAAAITRLNTANQAMKEAKRVADGAQKARDEADDAHHGAWKEHEAAREALYALVTGEAPAD